MQTVPAGASDSVLTDRLSLDPWTGVGMVLDQSSSILLG
jgi:hypothetical protein